MLTEQKGVKFPPQMNNKGDLAEAIGKDLDQSNVELLIGIDRGEIEWDPHMGTKLIELKHDHNSDLEILRAIAYREAVDQINTYLSELKVIRADVQKDKSSVNISIDYDRRDTLGTVTAGTANIEV